MLKGHKINEESKLDTIKCLKEGGSAEGTRCLCCQCDSVMCTEIVWWCFFLICIYGCPGSLLLLECPPVVESRATVQLLLWTSHYGGFSCRGAWAPGPRLDSCGLWAQLPRGTWDLPGPGIKLVSPAPQGRFSAPGPAGKPHSVFL